MIKRCVVYSYIFINGHKSLLQTQVQCRSCQTYPANTREPRQTLGAATGNPFFPVVPDDASQLHVQSTVLYSAQFDRRRETMPTAPSEETMFHSKTFRGGEHHCDFAPTVGYKTEGEKSSSSSERFAPRGGPGTGSHRRLKSSHGKLKANFPIFSPLLSPHEYVFPVGYLAAGCQAQGSRLRTL